MTTSLLLLAVALAGCATKTPLSPTSRIVLFCNPVGHAVDLALLGLALGAATYGGDVWSAGGSSHQRGEWSVPGLMCVDAINEEVDAAENSPPSSPKGD